MSDEIRPPFSAVVLATVLCEICLGDKCTLLHDGLIGQEEKAGFLSSNNQGVPIVPVRQEGTVVGFEYDGGGKVLLCIRLDSGLCKDTIVQMYPNNIEMNGTYRLNER